jgi:hypothetical protein
MSPDEPELLLTLDSPPSRRCALLAGNDNEFFCWKKSFAIPAMTT